MENVPADVFFVQHMFIQQMFMSETGGGTDVYTVELQQQLNLFISVEGSDGQFSITFMFISVHQ
ncbi:hypothetical protein M8C21_002967 [Ambrosia artemisiifolia]|uniref:Uncharacterized protein n=1 Tax=Ambrosia artemisiifolia TaxID=4212 RepID=A0AAD5GP13_AMBAR|nr:hypothetical protein M8C21_002967 [Ambrosia artemisiifolia]